MRSCCCVDVCLCIPLSLLGNGSVIIPFIVARQRLGKNPPIVARQRLSGNVTVVTNTHETIEELLDALFSIRPFVLPRTCCYVMHPPVYVMVQVPVVTRLLGAVLHCCVVLFGR
jgi:hypothetical protein